MHIDIYSDTICPWCYIGKKRLQRALTARPDVQPTIHWRAFQLNPWMPAAGVAREEYLRAKDPDLYHDTVVAEDAKARQMGIQGVPCFIVDGAYAVSGAQEPEYFMPLFDLVLTGQAAAE